MDVTVVIGALGVFVLNVSSHNVASVNISCSSLFCLGWNSQLLGVLWDWTSLLLWTTNIL